MNIDYEKSVTIKGDPKAALELARNSLMTRDFVVSSIGDAGLEAKNPQTLRNNHQDPLLAISTAFVRSHEGILTVQAEFGKVRRFTVTMTGIVLGIAVVLFVVFAVLGVGHHQRGVIRIDPDIFPFLAFLPFVPWPIILVFIGRGLKKNASLALDTLLQNMASVGGN
jgi:hypothetical protein